MNFDLTKTTDSIGVRYAITGTGPAWKIAVAKQITRGLVGGHPAPGALFEWCVDGRLWFRASQDGLDQPLQLFRVEFEAEHRELNEGICKQVELYLRMLGRRIARRVAFYAPLVAALEEGTFQRTSTRLCDLEQEGKWINWRLDELERCLLGRFFGITPAEEVAS